MKNKLSLTLLISILTFVTGSASINDSTFIPTPEGIGKHLAEMLINRADIAQSPYAINVDELLSGWDLKDFEDSPAKLFVEIFTQQQLKLPIVWNSVLRKADSLNIGSEAMCVKTYFSSLTKEQFRIYVVIESRSKYYTVFSDILCWKDKFYVMRVYPELSEFQALDDFRKEWSKARFMEKIDDRRYDKEIIMPEATIPYSYNHSFVPLLAEDVKIVSYDPLISKFKESIEKKQPFENFDFIISSDEYRDIFSRSDLNDIELEKYWNELFFIPWNDLLSSLKDLSGPIVTSINVDLDNILFAEEERYTAMMIIKIESEGKIYTCNIFLILNRGEWKLLFVDPLR